MGSMSRVQSTTESWVGEPLATPKIKGVLPTLVCVHALGGNAKAALPSAAH